MSNRTPTALQSALEVVLNLVSIVPWSHCRNTSHDFVRASNEITSVTEVISLEALTKSWDVFLHKTSQLIDFQKAFDIAKAGMNILEIHNNTPSWSHHTIGIIWLYRSDYLHFILFFNFSRVIEITCDTIEEIRPDMIAILFYQHTSFTKPVLPVDNLMLCIVCGKLRISTLHDILSVSWQKY